MPDRTVPNKTMPEQVAGARATSVYFLRWPLVSVAELDACPEAGATARRHVRGTLRSWGVPAELADDMELICAELVANAINATVLLHVPAPIGLRLLGNAQRLVLEVWDCHPGAPVRRPPSEVAAADRESGRGLAMVDEFASRWGTRRLSAHVKSVWAELLLPSRQAAPSNSAASH